MERLNKTDLVVNFMREIKGGIEIDAPVQVVWNQVVDFPSYKDWNPFMVKMDGELREGGQFVCIVMPPGRKNTNLRSTLATIKPEKELLFHSTAMGGLMKDDHLMTVESIGEGRTRFFQSIAFRGLLASLAGGTIKDCEKGIEEMNKVLKERCESK